MRKERLIAEDMVRFAYSGNTSYGVLDNIEMKGLYCSGACSRSQYFTCCYNTCSDWTFSNNYFHAWNIQFDNQCAAFSSAPGSTGTIFTNNVIDGSDSSPAGTCYGIYPAWPSVISNNIIHDLPNGLVGSAGTGNTSVVSGNLIYNAINSNGSNHCNMMEVTGGGTQYIYNNVMHDATCSGGEAMMVGSNGENSFIWNNLIYNISSFQPPNFPQTGGQAIVGLHFWNNTIVTGSAALTCFYFSNKAAEHWAHSSSRTTIALQRTEVRLASFAGISITSQSISNNTLMTPTTATPQGYTSSESFVYSPQPGCTPELAARWLQARTSAAGKRHATGNLAALANDTAYACTQQTVNGVVQAVCPARTVVPRPGDTGAYQYVAGDNPPNPPSGLTAQVQ